MSFLEPESHNPFSLDTLSFDQTRLEKNRDIVLQLPGVSTFFERYNETLVRNVRYERYMSGESREEWIALLGDDVSWYAHPFVTAGIADELLSYHEDLGLNISLDDRFRLFTACVIHDMGEMFVGDTTFEVKTGEDELFEYEAFCELIESVSTDTLEKLYLKSVYRDVVVGDNMRLGGMFNSIERVGYLNTCLRAYSGDIEGSRIRNWEGLCGNVLQNQVPALVEQARKYPYVNKTLQQSQVQISELFDDLKPFAYVPSDNKGERCFDEELLFNACNAWNEFLIDVS